MEFYTHYYKRVPPRSSGRGGFLNKQSVWVSRARLTPYWVKVAKPAPDTRATSISMNEYRTFFQNWLDSIPKVEKMILFTLGKVHDDGDSERLRKDRAFADSLNGLRTLILKKDHSPENWQSILEVIAHLPVDDKLYFLEDVIANNFSQEERKRIFACASANANERLSRIQKYVLGVKTLESSLSEDNLQRVFDAQKRVEEKEQ